MRDCNSRDRVWFDVQLKRLEEAAKQKEVDEELEDKEEETIPVLEAKIAVGTTDATGWEA